jgi:hypothetical protein
MNYFIRCIVLLILLAGLWSSAYGQASSTNYTLVTGSFVTSSTTTSSATATLTSTIPATITGVSSSSTYTAIAGPVIAAYTLSANYSGSAVAIVTPSDQTMQIAYAGDTGTTTGTFYYRQMGATSYSSVSLNQGTGDTLQYVCPSEVLTINGLEYYMILNRGTSTARVGAVSRPLVFRVQLTNAQAQKPTATPSRSYRMVSLPLNVSGSNTVETVFSDDLGTYRNDRWRLGRFNPSTLAYVEYPSAAPVIPGRAYWLITDEPDTYGAAGISIRPNRVSADSIFYTVPLEQGWNQVGNPFPFNVNWSEVKFDDNGTVLDHTDDLSGTVEDVAYLYNGSSYSSSSTLPGWGGVFVNALNTGVAILVPCRNAGGAIPKPVSDVFAVSDGSLWRIELSLQAGDKADVENYAGVHPEAQDGRDRYDYSEPPMAPEGCMLAFKPSGDDGQLRRVDYRPEFDEGATWDVVFSEGLDRKLTARGLNGLPDELEAWLIFNTGETIRLTEGQEIRLANDARSAQLVVGHSSFVASQVSDAMPNQFDLSQNFPNPFNPSTTIRFALPTAGHVELSVYNLVGQKVATVVDGEMTAGHHTVVWAGRNDASQPVASGIYFYRLKAAGFDQTRKMMLVK